MEEWITVKDAAQIRNCSERNIIRLIKAEELEAKKDGKRWLVHMDTSQLYSESSPQLSEVISALKVQLEEKDSQISKLQDQFGKMRNDMEEMRKDSADASQRHDTIVLQLTRQLEQSQRMLEAHREPWYKRMFGKGRKSRE